MGSGRNLVDVLLLAVGLGACSGSSPTQPLAVPQPSATPAATTIRWRIDFINQGGGLFGVRIRLDGQTVYENEALQVHHLVEVERPYARGAHEIDFELLCATERRGLYKAAVTVSVLPTGPLVHADGVPTMLSVGEHYIFTFDPEGYAAEQRVGADERQAWWWNGLGWYRP